MAIRGLGVWSVGVVLLLCCWQAKSDGTANKILSTLVYKLNSIETKLERHEYRQKSVGDKLIQMLSNIDNKHKSLELLPGRMKRVDERLSVVETTILGIKSDENLKNKIDEALQRIKKLESLSTQITETVNEIKNSLPNTADTSLDTRLILTDAKIEAVKDEIKNIKRTFEKDTMRALCTEMNINVNPLENHINRTEKLLNKYESRLNEYNETVAKPDESQNSAVWHNISEVFNRQQLDSQSIHDLLSEIKSISKELPKKTEIQNSADSILEAIAVIPNNIKQNNNEFVSKIEKELRDLSERTIKNNKDIERNVTQDNALTNQVLADLPEGLARLYIQLEKISNNTEIIPNIESSLTVLKKNVNYASANVIESISQLIKLTARSTKHTIDERFNDLKILETGSQSFIVTNLTNYLEAEIPKLYGQISVIRQQLIEDKMSLDALTNKTEDYVRSSSANMTKVKEEVSSISTRMDTLSDNMNHALGSLSVTKDEFQRLFEGAVEIMKPALKEATRNSGKTKDSGPGPHNIPSDVTP